MEGEKTLCVCLGCHLTKTETCPSGLSLLGFEKKGIVSKTQPARRKWGACTEPTREHEEAQDRIDETSVWVSPDPSNLTPDLDDPIEDK